MLLFMCGANVHAQSNEYLIKAGFIEKFTKFTQWPDSDNVNFNIVIIGKSPFNNEIEKLYAKRKIKNKKVKVQYVESIAEIHNCDILFISDSEKNQLSKIIEFTKNKAILTIAESKGFAQKGVHINFYNTREGTIHFEMNPKSIKKSNLVVDAILLNYAKIVN